MKSQNPEIKKLQSALEELRMHLAHSDKVKAAVSSVSVGWHITHSLMVVIKISEFACSSDPNKYRYNFNLFRSILFPLGFLPRGRGKAPKAVKPDMGLPQDTEELFTAAEKAVRALEGAHPKQHFVHHSFGMLDLKNTLVMMNIHTRHHLKIIKEIV